MENYWCVSRRKIVAWKLLHSDKSSYFDSCCFCSFSLFRDWLIFFALWMLAKWLLLSCRLCFSFPIYRSEVLKYFTDWVISKRHSPTIVLLLYTQEWNNLHRTKSPTIMPLIHLFFGRGFSPILLLLLFSGYFLVNKHNSCLAVRFFDGKFPSWFTDRTVRCRIISCLLILPPSAARRSVRLNIN